MDYILITFSTAYICLACSLGLLKGTDFSDLNHAFFSARLNVYEIGVIPFVCIIFVSLTPKISNFTFTCLILIIKHLN